MLILHERSGPRSVSDFLLNKQRTRRRSHAHTYARSLSLSPPLSLSHTHTHTHTIGNKNTLYTIWSHIFWNKRAPLRTPTPPPPPSWQKPSSDRKTLWTNQGCIVIIGVCWACCNIRHVNVEESSCCWLHCCSPFGCCVLLLL